MIAADNAWIGRTVLEGERVLARKVVEKKHVTRGMTDPTSRDTWEIITEEAAEFSPQRIGNNSTKRFVMILEGRKMS